MTSRTRSLSRVILESKGPQFQANVPYLIDNYLDEESDDVENYVLNHLLNELQAITLENKPLR